MNRMPKHPAAVPDNVTLVASSVDPAPTHSSSSSPPLTDTAMDPAPAISDYALDKAVENCTATTEQLALFKERAGRCILFCFS